MTSILHLPWPARPLWQNVRSHWTKRAGVTGLVRKETAWLAIEGGLRKPDCNAARLVWRFHPPSRRKIDVQNLIGALKAHVDGIADAMGIDDSTFRHAWPETLSEPVKGGAIIVEVTPLQIGEAQQVAA